MSDFESQVQVDMTGNLAAEAKRGERAIQGLSTKATRGFNRMRKASMGLSNAIDGLGNRYTGLVTGGGMALAARGVVDFDRRLKDIEVQAGLTGDVPHFGGPTAMLVFGGYCRPDVATGA